MSSVASTDSFAQSPNSGCICVVLFALVAPMSTIAVMVISFHIAARTCLQIGLVVEYVHVCGPTDSILFR